MVGYPCGHREAPIRPYLEILISAALAVAAFLAIFAALAMASETGSMARAEVPTAIEFPVDTLPVLSPRLKAPPSVIDAAASGKPAALTTATVHLDGEVPEGQRLVVTLFHGSSGAPLRSRELAANLPVSVDFDRIPVGDHEVRVALAPFRPRTNYIARAPVVATTSPATTAVHLAIRSLEVRLAASDPAPGTSIAGIPILLRRTDDPKWRPAPSGIATSTAGVAAFHLLGPGRYTLIPVGFSPAATERERLRFDLAAFDQARPITGRIH